MRSLSGPLLGGAPALSVPGVPGVLRPGSSPSAEPWAWLRLDAPPPPGGPKPQPSDAASTWDASRVMRRTASPVPNPKATAGAAAPTANAPMVAAAPMTGAPRRVARARRPVVGAVGRDDVERGGRWRGRWNARPGGDPRELAPYRPRCGTQYGTGAFRRLDRRASVQERGRDPPELLPPWPLSVRGPRRPYRLRGSRTFERRSSRRGSSSTGRTIRNRRGALRGAGDQVAQRPVRVVDQVTRRRASSRRSAIRAVLIEAAAARSSARAARSSSHRRTAAGSESPARGSPSRAPLRRRDQLFVAEVRPQGVLHPDL